MDGEIVRKAYAELSDEEQEILERNMARIYTGIRLMGKTMAMEILCAIGTRMACEDARQHRKAVGKARMLRRAKQQAKKQHSKNGRGSGYLV